MNVGSGPHMLEGFENLDNSPFLWLATVDPLRRILPRRHRERVDTYARARKAWVGQAARLHQASALRAEHRRSHLVFAHAGARPPDAMERMLADFHRVLRPGGTLHVVVPHFRRFTDKYLSGEMTADEYQDWLLFHPRTARSRRRRVTELVGSFGLSHLWQYDDMTAKARMEAVGFTVSDVIETPSDDHRVDDESSLHVFGIV